MDGDRKRPAISEITSTTTGGTSKIVEAMGNEVNHHQDSTPVALPVEVLDAVFEFLDGNGLLSCEMVSYRWRMATDRTDLWKRACLSAFPHLAGDFFDSPYLCCSAYEGDWRECFLDGNRANRSVVLDWNMERMGGGADREQQAADGNGGEDVARRFCTPFSLCGYSFRLLADPCGNPQALDQAEATGSRLEKGLSVYLDVYFANELQGPQWSGEFANPRAIPPPPLAFGPGHPWHGAGDGESEEDDVETMGVGGSIGGSGLQEDGRRRGVQFRGEQQEKAGKKWKLMEADDEGFEGEREENMRGPARRRLRDAAREGDAPIGSSCGKAGGRMACTGPPSARTQGSSMARAAGGRIRMSRRRDPHGLRWRRRRWRRRQGRTNRGAYPFSHVGNEEVIKRECCAAFSLTALNKGEGSDVTWVSAMVADRFHPERSSWGAHCLLPTSTMKVIDGVEPPSSGGLDESRQPSGSLLAAAVKIEDPQEGFLVDGSLTVRLRVRLLFLVVHVYTTADLASHRGFGVVPVRGKDRLIHYRANSPAFGRQGSEGGWGDDGDLPGRKGCNGMGKEEVDMARGDEAGEKTSGPEGWDMDGPLQCMTFEVLQCTTLEEMEKMVARALGLSSTADMRLWALTQPLTDGPLAPRELLIPENFPDRDEGGPEVLSLSRILTGHMMDDTSRVRLWVEQRIDGGFWEVEKNHPRYVQRSSDQHSPMRPVEKQFFASVRLASMRDSERWSMHQPLWWGGAGGSVSPLEQAVTSPEAGSTGSAAYSGYRADKEIHGQGRGIQKRERRILVFLKTLGLRKAGPWASSDDAESRDGPTYLTHVVLRSSSPIRALFELVASLLRDGTRPEDLGAYVEDLPCVWYSDVEGEQRSVKASGKSPPSRGVAPSVGATPKKCRSDGANDADSHVKRESRRRVTASGLSSAKRKRFLACPPLLSMVSHAPTNSIPSKVPKYRPGLGPGPAEVKVHDLSAQQSGGWSSPPASPSSLCSCGVPVSGEGNVCSGRRSQGISLACGGEAGGNGTAIGGGGARKPSAWIKPAVSTMDSIGVQSGASICFYGKGHRDAGRSVVEQAYKSMAKGLVEDMLALLRGQSQLGRVHLIKLPEVEELCESLGYQGFRARIANDQQNHVNARETLEYVTRGRHLAFICDSCGQQDFPGPRFHCNSCPDYDLCEKCFMKDEPAPQHRYVFMEGRWRREGEFHVHSPDHELEEMLPIPARGCTWNKPDDQMDESTRRV